MFTQLKGLTTPPSRKALIGKAKRASRISIHVTMILSLLIGPVASAKPKGSTTIQGAVDDFPETQAFQGGFNDTLAAQAVNESFVFMRDEKCTSVQDPLRCLGGQIDTLNRSVGAKIRDLSDRAHGKLGKGEDKEKYKDLKVTHLEGDHWNSFYKDIAAFLRKKGISSAADATEKYPEIGAALAEIAKLEGAMIAFQITGFEYPGDNKNFCHRTEDLAGGIFDKKQRTAVVANLIKTDKTEVDAESIKGWHVNKKLDCQVTCSTHAGSWECHPDGDFKLAYGAKTVTDFAVDCFDQLKGCNPDGTRSKDSTGVGTVPLAANSPSFVAAYQLSEKDFTERTNEFLMSTMMSSYIKLAKLNARNDQEMASLLGGLDKQLKGCAPEGDALEASADRDEMDAKALVGHSTREGDVNAYSRAAAKRESARKKHEQAKRRKLGGDVSVQKFASAQLDATLKDLEAKSDAKSARDNYQGRMAQAAQCTQRLADRVMKLQVLLYDNATARGHQNKSGTARKVGDFVANMLTPGVYSKLVEVSSALPSIDHAIKLDGDKLQPICGGWSERFTRNTLSSKDNFELSLDGAKFNVNHAGLGKLCDKLHQEEEQLISQMEGIYNEYPVLFSSDSHLTRTSVANEIMANLDPAKANANVSSYRKNLALFPQTTFNCQNSEGGMPTGIPAMDASGNPITATECHKIRGAGGKPLMALSPDFSKDPAYNGVGDTFDKSKGEPTCMDIAKQVEPTDAHVKATDKALNKFAKPSMDKLAKEIKKLACGDQGPDFYRDAVVSDDKLFGMYVNCDDRKLAASNAVETENSCEDRKTDKWMACVRRKTKAVEESDKKLSEATSKAQKQATGDMISGLMSGVEVAFAGSSMLRPTLGGAFRPFAGGTKATAKRMSMTIGMGMGFGGVIVGGTQLAGLMPSQADIDSLKSEAGWNEAMVVAGYGSARKASQSVKAALEMDDQPNPYAHAIVMAFVMGAVGGSFIHNMEQIAAGDAARAAKFKGAKSAAPLSKTELEAISENAGKLAALDPQDTLHAFKQWKSEMTKVHGAGKVAKAEKVISEALNQEILRKYGANLNRISLKKLSVEDRFQLLTNPELQKLSFPQRLAILMDPRLKNIPVDHRVEMFTDPELIKLGNFDARLAKLADKFEAKTSVASKRAPGSKENIAAYADAYYSRKSFDDFKVKIEKVAKGGDPFDYTQGLNILFLGMDGKDLKAAWANLMGAKSGDRQAVLTKYLQTPGAKKAYATAMSDANSKGHRSFSESVYQKLKAEDGPGVKPEDSWAAQYVKVATADLSEAYKMDFFKILKDDEDVVALLAFEERVRNLAAADPDFRVAKYRDKAKEVIGCCTNPKSCAVKGASLELELPNGQIVAACAAPEKWWN